MPKIPVKIRKGKFNPLNRRKKTKFFGERKGLEDRRIKNFVAEEQNQITKIAFIKQNNNKTEPNEKNRATPHTKFTFVE